MLDPWYNSDGCAIYCAEALETMRGFEEDSFDLIATDPPYFRVKGEDWDRQWDNGDRFIDWIGQLCEQWRRILRPNGSLYVFASPQMRARVEIEIGRHFDTLPTITWAKNEGRHRQAEKEALRAYFPTTEAIVFAEQKGSDSTALGTSGYDAKCAEIRSFVFEPLRAYIVGEFERAGMLNQEGKIAANVACGFSPSAGGMASRHYFSRSQWALPTEKHYNALRNLLNKSGGEYLRREYEDLRREYEDLRRPFSVSADVHYTDVWTFRTVSDYPGKHPCEKPVELMEHIVRASTRPGGRVLDCFLGGGTTGVACVNLDREFVGIELSENYIRHARRRIRAAEDDKRQGVLFESEVA